MCLISLEYLIYTIWKSILITTLVLTGLPRAPNLIIMNNSRVITKSTSKS